MSFMQELATAFNADLLKEVKTSGSRFVKTGTYTAQVLEVASGLLRDGETPKLDVTVQLLDEDLTRVGRAYIEMTPVEIRNQKGDLRKESELFYALMKAVDVTSVEDFVNLLSDNLVFSLYGTEYYNAKVEDIPEQLRDPKNTGAWQKVFVNADEDTKRQLLIDAGLKSRFMTLRVGKHRG